MEQKKRHLFIFSFKLLILLILLLLTVHFISGYVPYRRDATIDVNLHHLNTSGINTEYDIFFFSNSHLYTSIDPLYLNYLSGLKSIYFCVPSQRTFLTIETIKAILKHHRPKCIIVDLSRSSTLMPENRKAWAFNIQGLLSSDVPFSRLVQISLLAPESERLNIILEGTSDYTASIMNLNNWKQYECRNKVAGIPGYLGFRPLTEQVQSMQEMPLSEFNGAYFNTTRNGVSLFDEVNSEYFFQFFKEFSNEGMKVLFLSSLKLNSSNEAGFDSLAVTINNLSPEYYSTINLNNVQMKQDLALTKRDFSDHNHLTHSGALQMTEYLAPIIKGLVSGDSILVQDDHKMLSFNELTVLDYNLIVEDYYQKTLQLYFDSLPGNDQDTLFKIKVFPKMEFVTRLLKEKNQNNTKWDESFVTKDDLFHAKNGTFVATIFLKTKLKKAQIDRIEISSSNADIQAENSFVIFDSMSERTLVQIDNQHINLKK